MFVKLFQYLTTFGEPPRLVLNLITELMRFYPIFLKASTVLQRFV